MEDKFVALEQCCSVTCKTTDTIHGVAASNVSENPDGRLTTSSQLADESWAPVAQGHLGAPVRSIRALGSSAYSWLRIAVLPVVRDRSPPSRSWSKMGSVFCALSRYTSKFDLKHEWKGRQKCVLFLSGSAWPDTIPWRLRNVDRATESGDSNTCHVRYRYFCHRW